MDMVLLSSGKGDDGPVQRLINPSWQRQCSAVRKKNIGFRHPPDLCQVDDQSPACPEKTLIQQLFKLAERALYGVFLFTMNGDVILVDVQIPDFVEGNPEHLTGQLQVQTAFFLPALKPKERRWVVPTVAAMVLLFFLGMIFCFFVIQPAAFGWLLEQSLEIGNLLPEASDYLDIYMLLEIGFGIAFQLPLVIFYLSILHLVPYKTFRSQWRIVYVGFMVLSAVVTPDASPVTMILMFAVLIFLYEAALAVARFIIVARDGREALRWSREDYENRDLEKL